MEFLQEGFPRLRNGFTFHSRSINLSFPFNVFQGSRDKVTSLLNDVVRIIILGNVFALAFVRTKLVLLPLQTNVLHFLRFFQ